MISVYHPLKEMFGDVDFAWNLLEEEIKIEINQQIRGEDISHLLQLYMKGVQKMNSFADARESYFKNKVTYLMSRPSVLKTLNKPMEKKAQKPVMETTPVKKIDGKKQIYLKQKRKEMEMRLVYTTNQHSNVDELKKMMAEQTVKQSLIATKINKIVDAHEEKLLKRIKQRKLKTLTPSAKGGVSEKNDFNDISGEMDFRTKIRLLKNQAKEREGKVEGYNKYKIPKRKIKSQQPIKSKFLLELEKDSPSKRRVSMEINPDQSKIMTYQGINIFGNVQ